jgi:microcystin-dependent protein
MLSVVVARIGRCPWDRKDTPMANPYLGEIRAVPYNFAPSGWAFCNGQILPIAQNTALFSLLGTTYGGDGTTTFALPDLRGRVVIHQGQGAGLQPYIQGETGGVETVTLINTQIPSHGHSLTGTGSTATTPTPGTGVVPATLPTAEVLYGTGATTVLSPDTVSVAGASQPHDNHQPYLTINYIISLFGIFPSRN